jgi:ribosomal-protein-alanine N-acetyltransferase
MIATARLILVPASVALARAERADRAELGRLLGAAVPDNWPPETLADALPVFLSALEAAPEQNGWFGWYTLLRQPDPPTLVGSGGFVGPPEAGTVQIGYSVLPQFCGQGIATEIVVGLTRWALSQAGVSRVLAETEWTNPTSVRVLEKSGFVAVGAPHEAGGRRFELLGPPARAAPRP